jgi:3-oxoacyl-[acyl-carrier protein] reductase
VALCARSGDVLAEAARELKAETDGDYLAIEADLSTAEGVERALAQTQEKLGPIDILITNTGGPAPGRFSDVGDEDWDRGYQLLLRSAIGLIRGALPGMRERKWGRIIGVTSVSVKEPIGTLILSNVFRAGVTALFKTLATDVARDGVTVNTVLPGLTDTARLRDLYGAQAKARGVSLEDFLGTVVKGVPLRRLTQPEEFGDQVAFLASEAASGITGSAIAVDGGQLRGLY